MNDFEFRRSRQPAKCFTAWTVKRDFHDTRKCKPSSKKFKRTKLRCKTLRPFRKVEYNGFGMPDAWPIRETRCKIKSRSDK